MNSYSLRISQGKCEIQNPLKLGEEVMLVVVGDVVQVILQDTQSADQDTIFVVKCREAIYENN
jgi:hypothetical protein